MTAHYSCQLIGVLFLIASGVYSLSDKDENQKIASVYILIGAAYFIGSMFK